jgi:LEA14-like dessication related protein
VGFQRSALEPLLLHSTRRLLSAALIVLGLTAACAGSLPRINSDMLRVDIDTLEHRNDSVIIDLAMRNLNQKPLQYQALKLELSLDGEPLVSTRHPYPFVLPKRSRELVRVESQAEAAGLERLEALGGGQRPPMQWTMRLSLIDDRGRERPIDYDGWLHVVPGQANRFR